MPSKVKENYSRRPLGLPEVVLGRGSGPPTLIDHNFLTSCSILKFRPALESPCPVPSRAPCPHCPRKSSRSAVPMFLTVSSRLGKAAASDKFPAESDPRRACQPHMKACQPVFMPWGWADACLRSGRMLTETAKCLNVIGSFGPEPPSGRPRAVTGGRLTPPAGATKRAQTGRRAGPGHAPRPGGPGGSRYAGFLVSEPRKNEF